MTAIRHEAPTGEWETDKLDLDAYLERIAYGEAMAANAATLRGLHRAHAAAIAFENIDPVLGRTVELDLDRVQEKLVRRRRGGYCFEHNLLFAAVLERVGFEVTRLAARVQPGGAGPRTHMLLAVVADDRPWLADVGFGASLLEPLPLEAATVRQDGWSYRLDALDDGAWLLQSAEPDGWSEMYSFTLEPQRPIDYAVYNHYTATHPRSPFTGQAVVLRTEPDVKYSLHGLELTTTRPDGVTETVSVPADELAGVLADTFGIHLKAEEAAGLRARASAPEPGDEASPEVSRIHPYADGAALEASRDFYVEVLGLEVAMSEPVLGLRSPANPTAQVIVVPPGMEDPSPRLGVDVGEAAAVDAAHAEALRRGLRIVYPLTDEPWGVRRFFVEDPGGTIVNVLAHAS